MPAAAPLKILHSIGSLNHGGIEKWAVELLRRIDRSRFDMDFLVRTNDIGTYEGEIEKNGSRVIRCLQHRNLRKYPVNFARAISQYGPYDIIHAHQHDFDGVTLWLAAKHQIPVRISHSHNDYRHRVRKEGFPWRCYRSVSRRLIAQYATHRLAVSHSAGLDLFGENLTGDDKWEVVHYGIDLEPFSGSQYDRAKALWQMQIPPESFVVGHVGRFVEQKNHAFLLDIARVLICRDKAFHFVLIGDGPLRLPFEKEVQKYGLTQNFRIIPETMEVPAVMCSVMDAFLFPSIHEGLGQALIQAQAASLRCYASSTVPYEALVCPELVTVLGLAKGPTVWAEAIDAGRRSHEQKRPGRLTGPDVDINVTARRFSQIYLEAFEQCRSRKQAA